MTYSEQLQIIQTIPIKEGERRIITCPICYGSKKMSIAKADGQLMWNCFRASCNAKGIHSGRRSLQSTKDYMSRKTTSKGLGRPVPLITTSVENYAPAVNYLKLNNAWEAYQNNLIVVRYDPATSRILFMQDGGAVGRLLKGFGPKWLTYGSIKCGITVGTGSTVVLVEDVLSACSVSRIEGYVGLAMLGTKITTNIFVTLSRYTKAYLVLDKDASASAIYQGRKFGNSIKVRLTKCDLKLNTPSQILSVLNK